MYLLNDPFVFLKNILSYLTSSSLISNYSFFIETTQTLAEAFGNFYFYRSKALKLHQFEEKEKWVTELIYPSHSIVDSWEDFT